MNYVYGPVKSRRLGMSVGLSITPFKYCTLDCVYCQLKSTSKPTLKRKEYINHQAIISEVSQFFKEYPDYKKIDYVTFSGSGEPLLNSKIKEIIQAVKGITKIPVALITNSTMLCDPQVRSEILDLDLILPSLDAFTQDIFDKIDRPSKPNIRVEDILNGLTDLRQEFKGKIWLEIMLIKGINDDIGYLTQFQKVVALVRPDKIQLNVPSRPPSESWVKIPALERLNKAQEIFGKNCELV
ncbi:radical SAM protein [Thermoproteota archaeon]